MGGVVLGSLAIVPALLHAQETTKTTSSPKTPESAPSSWLWIGDPEGDKDAVPTSPPPKVSAPKKQSLSFGEDDGQSLPFSAPIPPSLSRSAERSKNDQLKSTDANSDIDLLIEDPGLPPEEPNLVEDVRNEEETEVLTKRPRPVRIPLSLTELENEKHQEAPAIDHGDIHSSREDQGIDALHASKPRTARRDVRVEEPTNARSPVAPIVSRASQPQIAAADATRLARAKECLDYYLTHPESTSVRSPWAVMHALLPFGADYELQHGNSRVNAIGWMCHNGTCRTQRMFTPRGRGFVPNVGPGVQGHAGQFLAILAQSGVPLDYPIQIGQSRFKVEDLVRYEMATCKERSELTFKLISLSYYLDTNKQWRANDGKVWSIPKLIQEELAQPIVGAACGGAHRLMGFSFSVRQRAMQGAPIDGQYARANQFVKEYIAYTWQLQNPDGSFSTSWYEGRANEPNNERKVQTTGHMLEWLMYTLPDSEINQPRVQKSIDFLLSQIYDNKETKWPIGPRGHATRAIALYHARYLEIEKSNVETTATRSRSDENSSGRARALR